MRNVQMRTVSIGVAALVGTAMAPRPAPAWVACGGFYRPPVVVCHPRPFYPGVGAAAVVGFAAGAAVASAARPAVVVAPLPTVVVTPPAIGSAITVLPAGSQPATIGGVHYYLSGGTWYRPYFGSNGVYYQVVSPP